MIRKTAASAIRKVTQCVLGATLLASTSHMTLACAQEQTLLLRDPAISEKHLAFVYAGDIWVSDRDGKNPYRLTSSLANEVNPIFSPDGSMIAYSSNHENNGDVYVIPTAGGQPKRLTWHPGADTPIDWAPDGSAVAFASRRGTNHGRSQQLFHVSIEGGLPEKQMDARIFRGAYNQDASKFAYLAFGPAYNGLYGGTAGWRGHRGGTTPSITIMDVSTNTAQYVSGERVNDLEPMWAGNDLYFISDRDDKILNIHHYDGASGNITKITNENVWDIRAADMHDGTIVYEAGGRIKQLNVSTKQVSEISVSINPDLPQLRPQWKDASRTIQSVDISPSGKRVAITARGDVFTVPVKDGTTRNLSNSDGAHDYTALWSPDGQRIAYIDAGNDTQVLVIKDQTGLGAERRINLGTAFYSLLDWGGKGNHIIYQDQHLHLYALNLASGQSALVSTDKRRDQIEVDVSPDGRWMAYTQEQENFNRALMLYNFAQNQSTQIGDALADVSTPAFSPDGKYLYFAASTNSGPQQVGLDLSSQERPLRNALYVAVLSADEKSPLAPKSGDEEEKKKDDKKESEESSTRIDVNGLSDRIIGLPVAERNYSNLSVAKDGTLYYVQRVQAGTFNTPPGANPARENILKRFKFDDREEETVTTGITFAAISAKGEHIVIAKPNGSLLVSKVGAKLDPKPVSMGDVRMMVNPRDEWNAIFDEAWRMEKGYFYDPALHGLDWQGVYDRYKPLVNHVGRREDLNTLIVEMIAEFQTGHNRAGGGDVHREQGTNTGLLGADFTLDNGRHRIARLYTGENWNPYLNAPLAKPGLGVQEGDYILAVNGRTLGATDNIFEALQGTAGKQVTLRISSTRDGRNARNIVVEPTGNEGGLRLWDWVEANRKTVEKETNGRVGYVYLPNTAGAGYTFFNRMFFSQTDKDAIILDERSNGGGQAANYITDVLSRTYLAGWKDRDGLTFNTPGGAMFGPKVMLIDQDAGSGGDFLPYAFREEKIGPLIGKRTWGGLIGISTNPQLIDGGFLTVPYFRFFDTDYKWTIENQGTAPDIDVALDPAATNAGRDSQLERAIAEIRTLLRTNPSPVPTQAPAYPTRVGN